MKEWVNNFSDQANQMKSCVLFTIGKFDIFPVPAALEAKNIGRSFGTTYRLF